MANKKSVINNNSNEVKTFITAIVIVVIALLGLFFITKALTKNGTVGEEYKPSEITEAIMTYDTLNIGMVFNRPDKEYYVAFGNFNKDSKTYFESVVDTYSSVEKNIAIYKVNMEKSYNKKYLNQNLNNNPTTDNELKIKVPTLIKIKNGKAIKYIENINKIKSELK